LHLVGYLLTQNYDARSHEHKIPSAMCILLLRVAVLVSGLEAVR